MTQYHLAALIPAFISVACVVAAWYILHPPPSSSQEEEEAHIPFQLLPRMARKHAPKPQTGRPLPPSPVTIQRLVSDTLTIPSKPDRKLIPSASAEPGRCQRVWKLNFTSECRDRVSWPTTSEWRADMSTTMRNVNSVRLRSVGLHAAEYTVDTWNRHVDLELGGTVYQVEIPVGNYTSGTTLATAVTTAITSTDAALAGFSVTYTASLDSLTITESTPSVFTLLWATGPNVNTSAYRTLGFDRTDTTSVLNGPNHEVSGQRIDLDGILAVDVFVDELTKSMEGPVGRVMLRSQYADAPIFQDLPVNETHTFWPIGRLQFLTFRFMVQYGHLNDDGTVVCKYRPYRFHGKHNTVRLDVGVTSYINPMENDVQLDPGV